ncbi:MAG: DNA repair protein RecO [Nitrospinota bacterium]
MPLFRDRAITLHRFDLGESSVIVSFFSRERGKIKGVAKGAKKLKSVFSGRMEPFHSVDVVYYGKEHTDLYRLRSIDMVSARLSIAEDLEKFSRACYMAELIEAGMKEHDPNAAVYDTAESAFEMLASESDIKKLDFIVRFFDLKFLTHIGYCPTLENCVRCRGPLPDRQSAAFDTAKGGLVCPDCRPKSKEAVPISAGAAKFLAKMADTGFDRINRLGVTEKAISEISGVITAFRNSRLQRRIKSERFFSKSVLK